MALLDIEMVRFEEIFLPYIETKNGRTVYERLDIQTEGGGVNEQSTANLI